MKISRRTRFTALLAAVIIAYGALDLAGPRHANLRRFDAGEVARLETAMWRSYYERRRVGLFFQMAQLLRTQYNAPFLRSNLIAYHAAKAAFLFKDGKSRPDYEQALPPLVRYYAAIRRLSDTPFDVSRAAQLELEWWIVHRERQRYPPGTLDGSLAELQQAIYNMPAAQFAEHGRLRAEAMLLRDEKWDSGRMLESDWRRIEQLLRLSWSSLFNAVNPSAFSSPLR
jgi:hypothetical protein